MKHRTNYLDPSDYGTSLVTPWTYFRSLSTEFSHTLMLNTCIKALPLDMDNIAGAKFLGIQRRILWTQDLQFRGMWDSLAVSRCLRFREMCCLHIQGARSFLNHTISLSAYGSILKTRYSRLPKTLGTLHDVMCQNKLFLIFLKRGFYILLSKW